MTASVTYQLSSDKVLQELVELRDGKRPDKSTCDVELLAEGITFPAHRVVLAASSEYFRRMFSGNFAEKKMKKIQLKDISEEGLGRVLDAIYNSEVTITEENIAKVTSAAHMLLMDDIIQYCELFLCENVTQDNVFTFLEVAEIYDLKQAVRTCNECVLDNFVAVAKTSEFCRLPKEKLSEYVSDDRLKLSNGEIEVFRAVVRWIENCGDDKSAETGEVEKIMKCVRFPFINVDLLLDEVQPHPFIERSKECKSLVREALRFHCHPLQQPLCEGPQYKARGEQKIIIVRSCERDEECEIKEETEYHLFSLLADGLSEDEKKCCPNLFVNQSMSAVACDNYLFLFATDTTFKPITMLFNSITEQWTELKAPPGPGTIGIVAVVVGKTICVTGGMKVTEDSPFVGGSRLVDARHARDVMLQYTIGSDVWHEMRKMPEALAFHGAVSHSNLIFVVGGYNKRYSSSCKTYAYDTARDVWLTKADMSTNRHHHYLECVDENLYACGGLRVDMFLDVGEDVLMEPSVEMYSIRGNQWTVLQNVTVDDHCRQAMSFVMDNKIYLVGGVKKAADNKWQTTDFVTCLDVVKKTMVKVSKLRFKSASDVCVVLNGPRK